MITIRTYKKDEDYDKVNQFLIDIYEPKRALTWVQPQWELMHFHPFTKDEALTKIGIFEREGEILAVVANEGDLGEAYFLVHPDYVHLKPKLLQYAEDNLGKRLDNGKQELTVYVKKGDRPLEKFIHRKRYKTKEETEVEGIQAVFPLDQPLEETKLPVGFTLTTLAETNDPKQFTQLFEAVYNNQEESNWRKLQQAPNFDPELAFVICDETGKYIAYGNAWFEEHHKIAYIDPVLTHPDYRMRGFAKAVVYACIEQLKERGATQIIAGSSEAFFIQIGFKPYENIIKWTRLY